MNHPAGEASNFDDQTDAQAHFADDVEPVAAAPQSPDADSLPDSESATTAFPATLLDRVLTNDAGVTESRNRLQSFLELESDVDSIQLWLGRPIVPGSDDKDAIARQLNHDVGMIDQWLNRQVNEIIHHPKFQKLEAAWRGLKYLHEVLIREHDPAGPEVKVKILDVSWKELEHDFESSFDIEQSSMFHKIYEEEYGTAGGEPFGILIGNYEVKPPSLQGHPHDDFSILSSLSEIAASAFSPFVTNASPELFELSEFGELEDVTNPSSVFKGPGAARWQSLCEKEDSRFLGLAMPRILMRLPYDDRPDLALARQYQRRHRDVDAPNEFCFQENVRGPDSSKYLWGGAAFAFAAVVIRAFSRTGWLTDIRGVQRNHDGGGLLTDLPVEYSGTDSFGVAPKISTDVVITDHAEKDLSDLGFIPLCSCYDSGYSAFYSAKSIQVPKKYNDDLANTNAHVSSMVYTMLCASRFAHYLKKIGRDMVGRFGEAIDIEKELQEWIAGFVTADSSASPEIKARYPLASANVSVREIPGKSGKYRSVFHLQPHYEVEGLSAGIRLVTEI